LEKNWDSAKKVLKADSLLQIGKDIVNGLIQGIGDMFNGVRSKVEELAGLIPEWAKKILGIHSPAKVFVQFKVNKAVKTVKQFVPKPNLPRIKVELAGVIE